MTVREQDEYSALRATIRERGTARVWRLRRRASPPGPPRRSPRRRWPRRRSRRCCRCWLLGVGLRSGLRAPRRRRADRPLHSGVPRRAGWAGWVDAPRTRVARPARRVRWMEHAAMAFGRPKGRRRRPTRCSSVIVPARRAVQHHAGAAAGRRPAVESDLRRRRARARSRCASSSRRHAASTQRAIDLERFQQLKAT